MVIAAAGAVDHATRGRGEAEARFASFAGAGGPTPEPARFGGGTRIEPRDLEQCAYRDGPARPAAGRSPDLYSLQVFTSALGGGMSSRLFQEVREKRGLCYSIYSVPRAVFGHGHVRPLCRHRRRRRAGTDAGRRSSEIGNAADTITEEEIARAKAQMKAGLLMALESSGARAEQLARQMIAYGRPIPLDEIVAQDRGGHGRERAGRRPRAAGARPAGDCGARAGHGLESAAHDRRKSGSPGRLSVRRAVPCPPRPVSAEPFMALLPHCQLCRTAAAGHRAATARDAARAAGGRLSRPGPSLREASRDFLVPWEPTWPADDLTRGAFRRRLRRYAEDQRDGPVPIRSSCSARDDGVLLGGLTIANVRRGVAAGRQPRLLDRARPMRGSGYMTAAVAAADAVRLRHAAAAPAGGGLHPDQRGLDPAAGKERLRARGLCARISVHQRHLAGPSAALRGWTTPDGC